jgi:UBX domain-containing protein 1
LENDAHLNSIHQSKRPPFKYFPQRDLEIGIFSQEFIFYNSFPAFYTTFTPSPSYNSPDHLHLLNTTATPPKMAGNVDQDALVLQLLEFVPNATPEQATQYLSANDWDLDGAAASLMADIDEAEDDAAADTAPQASAASASASASASQPAPPEYTGPRTLDGRPAPAYAGSSSSASKKPQPKKKGLATLSSLGGGGHDHEDDDSDEDYDDAHAPRDTYAGGEKSGLALQDPNNRSSDPQRIINDLLAKAKS